MTGRLVEFVDGTIIAAEETSRPTYCGCVAPGWEGPLNCAACKQPNDYAEANLPDGRYLCFECRRRPNVAREFEPKPVPEVLWPIAGEWPDMAATVQPSDADLPRWKKELIELLARPD